MKGMALLIQRVLRSIARKLLVTTAFFLLHFHTGWSNNVQITNVSITGQNTTDDFTKVEFDISWENSWRVVGGPGNWDAAWIFIKYRIGPGPWLHAWLNNTGHTNCGISTISTGLLNPAAAFDPTNNPGIGVFLYRSSPGSGIFNCQNVQLRWNYGANGLGDNEQVDIKVFAIEHVYIPEGAFKVGSGGIESGHFYTYPTSTAPYQISSENAITVAASNGNLYYVGSGDQSGPIPEEFPKGFKAFYAMKYEISQRGYVDFLNSLSRQQQQGRVAVVLSDMNESQYVLTVTSFPLGRNSVWTFPTSPPFPAELIFQNELNGNGVGNEPDDGADIACNYFKWEDVTAYLDWAGLRPMTELEYEKCARGTIDPFPNENCWGNAYVKIAGYEPDYAGYPYETLTDTFVNVIGGTFGPYRCGIMARSGTNRTYAGATYYGALDFSGNLWEVIVTLGNPTGRAFQGTHGNGILTNLGVADVSSWPGPTVGGGLKGGSFAEQTEFGISNRAFTTYAGYNRQGNIGGRGVRTAPQ
jgi:formylglycine-generating enzyme required for sulfatase activity